MKEIVVVAPTQDIYDVSKKIIEEHHYDNIDVILGTMSNGLRQAKKAVAEGAKILVSRGGTFRLCCEAFKLPVVEIKVSAYDIIQTLKNAEIKDRVLGVVGYNNVVDGFDVLRELLPYEIVKIELTEERQIQEVIEKYKKHGIHTYVGDTNAMSIAAALGFNGIVIKSQPDSVYAAIKGARRISRATALEKERTRQLETITDFVHDGVIAIDENARITVCNRTAAEILQIDAVHALGRRLLDVWPQSRLLETLAASKSEFGINQTVYGTKIVSTRIPILVDGVVKGGVETFQSIDEIQNIEHKARRTMSAKGFVAKYSFSDIVYCSDSMRRCVAIAKEYAKYDAPVMIGGESGVGKELFAQSIHNASARRENPFIAVNCAALPPSLIESELFGYEEGAFTGAKKQGKPGVFELAHNGTIFLDEIAELPPNMQGLLLRVLQEKEVVRIGGDKVIPVNIKVICGSNRNLGEQTKNGAFREDLFFRINVLKLEIPPLRERREDIMLLAGFFNELYSKKYNKPPVVFTKRAVDCLSSWKFDGNVRELQSLVARGIILSSLEGIYTECRCEKPSVQPEEGRERAEYPGSESGASEQLDLKAYENRYIADVYRKNGGNVKKTCDVLKIDRTTLWRRMKQI